MISILCTYTVNESRGEKINGKIYGSNMPEKIMTHANQSSNEVTVKNTITSI